MQDKRIPKYTGPDSLSRKSLMSRDEIKARFDGETASLYSQRDPAWLPEFKYSFGLIGKIALPFIAANNRVLDMGAGTGNLSRTILDASEDARLVLMDFSKNMLDEAPNVLARYKGRFETIEADFMSCQLGTEEYGAVVSSFAIHHCRGTKEYESLYAKIFASLSYPGIFINCDVVAGDTPHLSEFNEHGWIAFLREQGFGENEITKIMSNYHVEDSPESLRTHMELLVKAGFTGADVIWKKANFAVYAGIKNLAR